MKCQVDFSTLEAGTESCSPRDPKMIWIIAGVPGTCIERREHPGRWPKRENCKDEERQLGFTELYVPGSVLSTLHM